MIIIVNDANILIDMVELKILPYFFQLNCTFYTTDIILNELFDEQKDALEPYIIRGTLIVEEITEEDLIEILNIRIERPTLSEQDCSAFYQASKKQAALITSDNTLRKFAKEKEIEVHGHLWVFDNLFEYNIISGSKAIEKLEELNTKVDPKLGLPKNACLKLINKWKN